MGAAKGWLLMGPKILKVKIQVIMSFRNLK